MALLNRHKADFTSISSLTLLNSSTVSVLLTLNRQTMHTLDGAPVKGYYGGTAH
jgi:hypothetical protein